MEHDIKKQYSNGDVTVVWEPKLCIHSAICINGLPEVFNARIKPWVNIENSSTQNIINQIKKCPSGALSYFMNTEKKEEVTEQEIIVEVAKDGPVLVYGNLSIKDAEGNVTKKNKCIFSWKQG